MTVILTIVKLLIILGVVTTIHEFGHFLMAKLFKIGVEEFSIGFGPKIFQFQKKETKYTLRCLPLGGYCAIVGEGEETNREDSFKKKPAWQQIIVLVMGVTFNAILAVIIFVAISFSAKTETTIIEEFSTNSIAEQAGLQKGDEIYKINGKRVHLYSDLVSTNVEADMKNATVEYIRDGKKYSVVIENPITKVGEIGVAFLQNEQGMFTNTVNMVEAGSAADIAKLKDGDIIKKINGINTSSASDIVQIVKEYPEKEIEIVISRDGEDMIKKVTPKLVNYFSLGIYSTKQVNTTFSLAVYNAKDYVLQIVNSYIDLFRGKVSINQMSGIVGVGQVVAKTNGITQFFKLIAILSMAIGIANILPFPPLDGGKVLLVIIEWITKKKISENVELAISYIGFGLLIILTVFVTYNDIIRII